MNVDAPSPRISRRAWAVWGVGLLAYVVAVFNRSSLGVAGLDAAERFGVPAATLATFSVVQLVVYAAMQVPVGVLLDRFGTRRMVAAGSVLMAGGQALFAVADSVGPALVARTLVGAGDAMIFISVLRLVAFWFPARRSPLVQQLTGIIGQAGAIVAAVPLVTLLDLAGWTSTFVCAAATGLFAAVLVVALVRDAPVGAVLDAAPATLAAAGRALRAAWREPGTRLGLWTHFVTQFSGTTFLLLWGYPFLVEGEGLSPAAAGATLTLITLVTMAFGPVLGQLVGRHPFHRSRLVLLIVAATAIVWTVVLLWPGRIPLWLVIVLAVTLATNGPGSMIAFDFARTFNPPSRSGSASGIANIGGFTASLVTVLLIGAVLDLRAPAGARGADDFRMAFAVQYVLWATGAVQVVRYRRRVRRLLSRRDPEAFAALRAGRSVAAQN